MCEFSSAVSSDSLAEREFRDTSALWFDHYFIVLLLPHFYTITSLLIYVFSRFIHNITSRLHALIKVKVVLSKSALQFDLNKVKMFNKK